MALAAVIFILLGFAAWRDIATRTIPDAVSIAIMLVGVGARLPGGLTAIATSAAAAVLLFVVLLPLHGRGLLGGGDLKLLAALALGLPPLASYQMISAVVLAGGILALVYVALRRILIHGDTGRHAMSRRGLVAYRVLAVELWRIRKGAPLPYGLAIAAGASLVIVRQGA